MQKIIINQNNLSETDITEIVKRVKILLINSNNEILLAYSHHNYQFPGGHVEDDESLLQTVKREILEETGIDLATIDIEPFACTMGYYKDWPEKGKNRKTEIYYYEIKTDEKPNLDNTSYSEHEKDGNFELRYIPLDTVEDELRKNVEIYSDAFGITKEMLMLFTLYKSGLEKI